MDKFKLVYILSYVIWFCISFSVVLTEFYNFLHLLIVFTIICNLPFFICFIIKYIKNINRQYEFKRYILTLISTISIITFIHLFSLYIDDLYVIYNIKNSEPINIKSNQLYGVSKDLYFTIGNIKGTGIITIGRKNNVNYTRIIIKNSKIDDVYGNLKESAFLIKKLYINEEKHKAYYTLNEGSIINVEGDLEFILNKLNAKDNVRIYSIDCSGKIID